MKGKWKVVKNRYHYDTLPDCLYDFKDIMYKGSLRQVYQLKNGIDLFEVKLVTRFDRKLNRIVWLNDKKPYPSDTF